jgi:hypothetical protein
MCRSGSSAPPAGWAILGTRTAHHDRLSKNALTKLRSKRTTWSALLNIQSHGSLAAYLEKRPGPLLIVRTIEDRETGPASSQITADSLLSLPWGSRPWNLSTEFSSVMTAAPNSCSRRANSCFSTTNNLKTTPSTASSARQSEPAEVACDRKPGPRARRVEWKRRFHSSPRRAGLCFAVPVFRSK